MAGGFLTRVSSQKQTQMTQRIGDISKYCQDKGVSLSLEKLFLDESLIGELSQSTVLSFIGFNSEGAIQFQSNAFDMSSSNIDKSSQFLILLKEGDGLKLVQAKMQSMNLVSDSFDGSINACEQVMDESLSIEEASVIQESYFNMDIYSYNLS